MEFGKVQLLLCISVSLRSSVSYRPLLCMGKHWTVGRSDIKQTSYWSHYHVVTRSQQVTVEKDAHPAKMVVFTESCSR